MNSFEQTIDFFIDNDRGGNIIMPPKRPDNFFDIGTRGHFENPFTEILAYLLLPHPGYTGAEEFAKLFFEFVLDDEDARSSLASACYVSTQVPTAGGKFMDMVAYNDRYVVAFENKIDHWLANPLRDYEREITRAFRGIDAKYFVLSKNIVDTPMPWINRTIGDVFKHIRERLKFDAMNKWDVFIREFLDHYIMEAKDRMKDQDFAFCATNYRHLHAGKMLLEGFIQEIICKVKEQCRIFNTSIRYDWGDDSSIAIRFSPNTVNANDVVLVLGSDGKYRIRAYTDPKTLNDSNGLESSMTAFQRFKDGHETRWVLDFAYTDFGSALAEVLRVLALITVPASR